MSRRTKNTGSNVRGPNSALTEFLRVEGITDAFRRRREIQQDQAIEGITSGDSSTESSVAPTAAQEVSSNPLRQSSGTASRIENPSEEEDEIVQMRAAARRKRRAARRGSDGDDDFIGADDDDDDDDEDDEDYDSVARSASLGNEYKQSGQEDVCVECEKLFELTVYSRYDKVRRGYLCEDCNQELKQREKNTRRNQQNARRKRKKVAQALLDKTTVSIPTLQDICIKYITSNIDQVEALGGIGSINMNKISKILSKNRSLNNETMTLFLNPDSKSLEFWDCSNVDSDSFNKIASYCPNLESLTLFMCGQLHNDNFEYYSDKLTKLTELNLNGPFLINEVTWQDFFESCGKKLEKLEIRNTHRFSNDSLIGMLENCGKNLTSLKLSRLDGLTSAEVYELIPHYLTPNSLTHLEISYPKSEELVTDELLINLLAITGGSLVSLNVDGCTSLTNNFINEGISSFCKTLTHLSMKGLDQINEEANFKGFNEINGGLISLDLNKCIEMTEAVIYDILKQSCTTLVELNLNSLDNLSKNFFWQVLTDDYEELKVNFKENNADDSLTFYSGLSFPLLTTLNVGFVRSIDDQILNLLSKKCPKLKILEVFGDNRCTYKAKTRSDMIIIGRQGDAI
ncbi:UV-damaged DNA-binding protein rad7 [Yamadazyma tenuis]|uniref:DNA repair protein rhp7 treble clef domain-containing protein n=1 Tax=Candida tenuis (strain ATCC 10573 / BCRC 21748 / CBS 615 / JCM 9827 / NBRC 10315 / NRRL Y-1498 / VKM Y-70) TaxID=590646 RepID=G3BCC6_CANTC|nr:uncharacterized protein CANTEDRAFT_128435 [Yamadazyma tenuis ATCC 10573]EGV60804.1 hypothetical protein CANTEDRAFT_128435 [Yamadazyma tenuis ATCC 10573]WEJ93929.1 UV-damaged DNA-binding protein rad7 [Yamadazyma tenuis]